jgi:hypothetical protein
LLEKAGAFVYQIPWTNDFAAARNSTLDHITTEWTLHLDADEFPSMDMLTYIKRVLTEDGDWDISRAAAVRFFTRNFWAGEWGIEVPQHWHVRMFRTRRGQWYKPLHEQVKVDGKEEHQYVDTPLCLKPNKEWYLIHSKPRDKIEVSAQLYRGMER